jgi:hypothetical protein
MDRVDSFLRVTAYVLGSTWAACVIAFCSDAGLTVPGMFVLLGGGMVALAASALSVAGRWVRSRKVAAAAVAWRAFVFPAALAVLAASTWFGATFWMRFLLSRPALDRFVRNGAPAVAAGRFVPGEHIGLFRLQEAEVLPGGIVRLITTDCMFDHCGVVYSPQGPPPRVGEDTYSPLGGGWWHWWRSW